MEMRALVLRDLAEAGLVPKDYYGRLREYEIETAILDRMLGQELRFSSAHSGIPTRLRRAADLLIHFGLHRETTWRANLAKEGIHTLRQLFGPRAETTDFLKEFEDIPKFGDFDKLLASMDRHFPDLVRGYADCFPKDERSAVLAYIEEKEREAETASTKIETVNGIDKQNSNCTFTLRRNSLDPAIDKAINLAGNTNLADVYLQLKELALQEEKPFNGLTEGNALCYTNDNGEPARLTKNALGKRLKSRAR